MDIVLASNNPGKIVEIRELLKGLPIQLVPQSELGVSVAEETGLTFVENALLKARHACRLSNMPAIADDSGLTVDALHGAPGVYSARYAGKDADDAQRINKLLTELSGVSPGKRQATFHCVSVYLCRYDDPAPVISHGRWEGMILQTPQGQYGFGYDPIFYVPSEQCSAAELLPSTKNCISHRAQALAEFKHQMVKVMKMHENVAG